MINKGDKLNLVITSMGSGGEGVARVDGMAIFVQDALLTEEVIVEILSVKSNYATARVIKIVKPSPERRLPPCPYYGQCGGCNLQHASYSYQLQVKTNTVQQNLSRIAGKEVNVPPCKPSEKIFGYRNKVSLPIGDSGVGMFCGGSHKIVPVEYCMLAEDWLKNLIKAVNQYINTSGENAYNGVTRSGNLRHLVARYENKQLLVCVVTATGKLKDAQLLASLIGKEFNTFGLYINNNPKPNAEILSGNFTHVFGLKELQLNSSGISYTVSVHSFMQVNSQVSSQLYAEAVSMVTGQRVVNAYSGAGLLSAILAKSAQEVIGIECNKSAHKNAQNLIKTNNIKNVINICGKVEEELPKLKSFDAIVLDPPRKGCDAAVLQAINKVKPAHIVYISCDSATLARDIKQLRDYTIKTVHCYDMFPQTRHVETLVCLSKD